jgi:hypothetical protein
LPTARRDHGGTTKVPGYQFESHRRQFRSNRSAAVNLVRFVALRVPSWAFALALLFPAGRALASWAPNGNQINPTVVPDAGAPVPLSLAPDGRGGVFLASGYDTQARLTHILDTGALAPGWSGDNGFFYFDGGYWPVVPDAVPDGDGGVFIISSDLVCFGHAHCAGNATLLRAHHVDFDRSTEGWNREGIFLGSGTERSWDRRQAVSIASEAGSVITTWADPVGDFHYLTYGGVLRAQRVDITGALPWGPNGVVVRDTLLRLFNQTMAPDGMGGAFVFWQDDRLPGIYGQHIAADGRALWTTGGIPIALEPMTGPGPPVAVPDGAHGAIVAWSGASGSLSGVFAARVTPEGLVPSPHGQQVFAAGASHVDGLRIVPAEPGGVTLAWRSLLPEAPDRILAQQLDHAARPRWSPSGVVVCEAQGTRDHMAIASDLQGGAYIAWIDNRPGFSVYGMHLDQLGRRVLGWSRDGEPICARIPLTTSAGGTASVSELVLTTIVKPAQGARNLAAVSSRFDRDPSLGNSLQASAMVVWADDRTQYSGGDWTYASPFAMLLTPHGPATAPVVLSTAPISVNPPVYSQTPASSHRLSLSMSSTGAQTVNLRLDGESPALLEVFDVGGRRVWSREVGGLGPGQHEIHLGDGEAFPSGVYMARLTQGSHDVRAHVAVIH